MDCNKVELASIFGLDLHIWRTAAFPLRTGKRIIQVHGTASFSIPLQRYMGWICPQG